MKTMKIWRLAFAVLAAFSLASCSSNKEDGDWDPMVWKAEVPVVKSNDGVYDVSAEGATFTFSCLSPKKFRTLSRRTPVQASPTPDSPKVQRLLLFD